VRNQSSSANEVEFFNSLLGALTHEAEGRAAVHVTISVGLTLVDPDVSVEESIDRADKALYAAKAKGRNAAVIWDASMSESEAHFERA